MKIGIFSGSFNPIHIGHIILANYVIEHTQMDEMWFLVTPHNPLKEQRSLLDEIERLRMVELAVASYSGMYASDFEFSLPKPSYTIDTFKKLEEKYPEHEFSLIIGSDNWENIENWKDYKQIIDNYKILVYPRLGHRVTIPKKLKDRVEALDSPIIEVSSTHIREELENGNNIRPFVPIEVFEYITEKQLYRKKDE